MHIEHTGTFARVFSALVLGCVLSACSSEVETSVDDRAIPLTYLPENTLRINVREERDRQLATGDYRDDIPEYTGAPGVDALWPAYVPRTRKTVYRGQDVTTKKPN